MANISKVSPPRLFPPIIRPYSALLIALLDSNDLYWVTKYVCLTELFCKTSSKKAQLLMRMWLRKMFSHMKILVLWTSFVGVRGCFSVNIPSLGQTWDFSKRDYVSEMCLLISWKKFIQFWRSDAGTLSANSWGLRINESERTERWIWYRVYERVATNWE